MEFKPYDGKYKGHRFLGEWEIVEHVPKHTDYHGGQDFSGSYYRKQTTYRVYKLRHVLYGPESDRIIYVLYAKKFRNEWDFQSHIEKLLTNQLNKVLEEEETDDDYFTYEGD